MRILVAVTISIALLSCKGGQETIHPEKRDLTQAVYASGKIFPKNDYKVSARLPGYVQEILVHVGDTVSAGQPLLRIKSEISAINVDAAKNQYNLASNNASESGPVLSALKQEVSAAESKYLLDSTNYKRFENLLASKSASQLQFDQSKVQFESSRAAWTRAKYTYSSTRDRLRTEAQNAKLQLDAQTSNQGDYTIISAVSGKVYDIMPKIGDLVSLQIPLVEIGSATEFEVELSIDETDISLVVLGQEVLYEIDAYKDIPLTGTVMEIYPRISPGNKTAKIIASVSLADDMIVYSGMSIESNIIVSEKKSVLVIPREYLKSGNTVNVKGKEEPVKITVGAGDLEFIEVTSGISEADELEK
jgi:multidrug efflux pump subunit AcrA (membrane-fusion protein)